MTGAQRHDPLAAMRAFMERVVPFDPAPDGPAAAVIEVRVAGEAERFTLTGYAGRALVEALCRYYDPADVGPCDECGKRRLDTNLQCRDCGHVNGVFGQMLLEHVEKLSREGREVGGA